MALVSLDQAKRHLRIDTDEADPDIYLKMEQAEAIILDYLKGRTLVVDEITRSGAVATVTTVLAHGLTTGATITIRGATQPEYNSTFAVTVINGTTFTFPVTGTPDSPATGPYVLRASAIWTDTTVPGPVQAAILLMLTHLHENRGDAEMERDEHVWQAIGRLLMRLRDPALA
jgi:hypothetical protein